MEQEKDKTEPASPFKLEEAKRRGQVGKSLDLNSFFVLAALLAVLYGWGESMVVQGLRHATETMGHAHVTLFETPQMGLWLGTIGVATIQILAPFFVAAVIVAVLGNLLQTGPVFSTQALKPDPQRLNPVAGFKRVFSRRMLFEGGKSIVKLLLFGAIAYQVLKSLLPDMMALANVDPKGYFAVLYTDVKSLLFKLGLIVLLVAIADAAYTRWDYAKRMMMSRRELKEEVKRREGDPHVRARQRELQREAVKRAKSVKRVPEADVLITNPTHFAVALLYRQGEMAAPVVIAKGMDDLAQHMRTTAYRHGVKVMEQPPLARALFREVDIDRALPERFFEPVARIYAQLQRPSAAAPSRVEVRL